MGQPVRKRARQALWQTFSGMKTLVSQANAFRQYKFAAEKKRRRVKKIVAVAAVAVALATLAAITILLWPRQRTTPPPQSTPSANNAPTR